MSPFLSPNTYYNRFDYEFYISSADAGATYPFTVRIKEDSEWELYSEETFYITIANPNVTSNHTPVAHPDYYEVGLGDTLTVTGLGVFLNDGDDQSTSNLQMSTHTAPSGVTVNSNGTFSWTPTVAGIFYWTYRAIDVASGISNLGFVQVQVDDADIDIFDGQDGNRVGFGNGTDDLSEETVGAFTVANLNDTDGDGIVDSSDNDVRPPQLKSVPVTAFNQASPTIITVNSGHQFVVGEFVAIQGSHDEHPFTEYRTITAINVNQLTLNAALSDTPVPGYTQVINQLGVPEVDLMKIKIRKPAVLVEGRNLTLTIQGGTVWKHSWKGERVPADGMGVIHIDPKQFEAGDITWWVEAGQSSAIRDIVLTLTNGQASDVVKATGIWADVSDAKYTNLTWQEVFPLPIPGQPLNPWEHVPETDRARDYLTLVGGTGVRQIHFKNGAIYNANVIIMQFKITPGGVNWASFPQVVFDATRRAQTITRMRSGDEVAWSISTDETLTFPFTRDKPNDDPNNDGESQFPSRGNTQQLSHAYFYSLDTPAWRDVSPSDASKNQVLFKTNFEEYLRIGIGKARLTGKQSESLWGSRASPFYEWHNVIHLVTNSTTGLYERGDENGIGTDFINLQLD